VVKQLTDLTVSYQARLGIRGDFSETLQVVLEVEKHQYKSAIAWYVLSCTTSTDRNGTKVFHSCAGCGIYWQRASSTRKGEPQRLDYGLLSIYSAISHFTKDLLLLLPSWYKIFHVESVMVMQLLEQWQPAWRSMSPNRRPPLSTFTTT
jgi:hypothetical protein